MFIGQCLESLNFTHGLGISLFLAGLVGGVTHCAGMCGPFVLAQTGQEQNIGRLRDALLLPYHAGRMTTYVVMAGVLGSVVNLAFMFSDLKVLIAAPMLMLAAVIFLVSAFPQFTALFPWVTRFKVSAPYAFISQISSKLMHDPGVFKRYGLGVLLGFMPCGLVISAVLAAATAPSALEAGAAMAAFALGTVPALVGVGLGGQALKARYPQASRRVSQGAMVISGLWLFALAGQMIFYR